MKGSRSKKNLTSASFLEKNTLDFCVLDLPTEYKHANMSFHNTSWQI